MSNPQIPQEIPEEEEEVIYRDLLDVVVCQGCGNEIGWSYSKEVVTIREGDETYYVSGNYYHCRYCGHVHEAD